MQLQRTFGVFVSGCFVYVAVAACSSSGNIAMSGSSVSGSGGHAGSSGHGGAVAGNGGHGGTMPGSGGNGASGDSGIVDALTDPVPDAFAGSEDPASGTRLKGKFIAGADGSKMYLPSVWSDSQRQEDCAFGTAGDGMLRCLPTSVQDFPLYYTDAQCTKPFAILASGPPPSGCAANPPKYNRTTDAGGACPMVQAPPSHYYPIGQQISQPQGPYYATNSGSCAQSQIGFTTLYFSVMAEVPATSFVAGTVGTDP
jgi:hypothetical protein